MSNGKKKRTERSIRYQIPLQRILTFETDNMTKKWDNEFDKLEEGYDKFREYFDKNRTCKCKDVDDCKHFDRALKIFDKKLDELDDLNLKIFGRVYEETIKPTLEKK